jgi:hypothetical protein
MKYYTYARLFPAILTSIPFILFYYFTSGTEINKFLSFTWTTQILTNVAASSAIIYGLVQLNRLLSKEIFQKLYFKDEMDMPTTRYLLWKDDFIPEEIKIAIRCRITKEFNIELLTKEEEHRDEERARKMIIFAISQIRRKLKNNTMLLRHNMEYGFVRNSLAGCLIALLMSLANAMFFSYYLLKNDAFTISIILGCIYFVPLVMSKVLMKRFGHYYAKILFEQYLG